MKLALVYCPFFTNGEYPPLGLACINAALRQAGHETVCFDFCWFAARKCEQEMHLIREFFPLARVKDEVVFALAPELGLFLLYGEDAKRFQWRLAYDGDYKPAAVALCLSLWNLVPRWASLVLAQNPEAVFFSTYSSNYFLSLYFAKQIRKLRPGLPLIFGGPGSSLPELREFALSTGLVDGLVCGEGEMTVTELCADLGGNLAEGVPGLAVRKKGTTVYEPRELAPDLDALPRPDFQGLPFPGAPFSAYNREAAGNYLAHGGFPVYSTRGCVNRCAYCSESVYWKKFRQRGVENVIGEIASIREQYRESRFAFGDSALNGRPGWLEQFCDRLGPSPSRSVFWSYLIPDKSINDELAQKMFRAGFANVSLGVETFSATIRKRINKGMDGDQLFAVLPALTRAGVNVVAHLLAGFPGETEDEFETSVGYIEKWNRLPASERGPGKLYWEAGHRVRIEAYSRFYTRPDQYGIKIFPYQIPLPEELSRLREPLSGILLKWRHGVDEQTFQKRSRRMKQIAHPRLAI